MMKQIKPEDQSKPEADGNADTLQAWRATILKGLLRAALIFGGVSLAIALPQVTSVWFVPVYAGAYLLLLLVTVLPRIPYHWRVWGVLLLVYVFGLTALWEDGLSGDGRVFLLVLPFLAIFFWNIRTGIIALLVSVFTLSIFALLFTTGQLPNPETLHIYSADPFAWLSGTLVYALMGCTIILTLGYLIPRLAAALATSQTAVQDVERARAALEERARHLQVARDLLRNRTSVLELTAEMPKIASEQPDKQRLLSALANLIASQLGLFHVGIFLLDETATWAVLEAFSGDAAQVTQALGLRLRVGEEGLVGQVAATGRLYNAPDITQASFPIASELITAARAELVLPLIAQGRVMGVLDVLSAEPAAFDAETTGLLETIAEQLALVINNAQLLQQVQASLESERHARSGLTLDMWRQLGRQRPVTRYDPAQILDTPADLPEHVRVAVQQQSAVNDANTTLPTLALPITSRDQVVGVINAVKLQESGAWTKEEMALLTALLEQLGVALEGARLYEDTQRRAARERLTREITDKMRRATSMENLISTAVQEVAAAFGSQNTFVQLKPPQIADTSEVTLPKREKS